jgi:GNAT superfamily N-acetyltransferase
MQATPKPEFTLRRAVAADGPGLIHLIIALAQFERLTPPDEAAQARLLEHGFGDRPRFETWLAFVPESRDPVAYAMIFETYSSFLARPPLYLEDIFVLPEFRGRGIGGALLKHCITLAHERDCGRVEWTCLDWNTKAQCVYEGLGARRMSEWYLYRLTRDRIAELTMQGR